MVLRLSGPPAVDGAAASLFKSAADLSFDGARLKAQAMGGIGAGLESAAKSHQANKQRKVENARADRQDARAASNDALNAQYKQFEMYHANASLMGQNVDREEKAIFEAVQSGDHAGVLAHTQLRDSYAQSLKMNMDGATGMAASHGMEIGTDGLAKPNAGTDHG